MAPNSTSRTTYDDADRLTRIEKRNSAGTLASVSEFGYDYANRRALTREYDFANGGWANPQVKWRVFHGLDVVQERNANNEVTAQLVRDGNIGGILSRTTSAGAAFYGYDGNGNVTLLTNSAGADVGHYRYDAFGNTLEAEGARAGENPYRFSTKELHGPSGLYDYGLRFYSPGMGRWLNRDPIEEEGGVNLYTMVGNNPINSTDAYGLVVETPWDVANVTLGSVAFYADITSGKYSWAALDAAGIAYDVVATGIPVLPAGASAGIKVARAGAALKKLGAGAGIATGASAASRNVPNINIASRNSKGNKPSRKAQPRPPRPRAPRSPHPIGLRHHMRSKKAAFDAAKKASGGKNPVLEQDKNGWHYHKVNPNTGRRIAGDHEHWFFPGKP